MSDYVEIEVSEGTMGAIQKYMDAHDVPAEKVVDGAVRRLLNKRKTGYEWLRKERTTVHRKTDRADRIKILELLKSGVGAADIASMYGVSRQTVYNIKNGKEKVL